MRKSLLILVSLFLSGMISLSAQTFSTLNEGSNSPRGISANGKYIIGIDATPYAEGFRSYVWDFTNSSSEWVTNVSNDEENGSLTAISNNGIAVGFFVDWDTPAGDENPPRAAAVWINGERIPLGYGSLIPAEDVYYGLEGGSYATCINPDGTIIGGYLAKINSAFTTTYIPCIWKYNEANDSWDITEYTIPEGYTRGATITSISEDGKVVVGTTYVNLYATIPAIFIDGIYTLPLGLEKEYTNEYGYKEDTVAQALSVSENGKYVAIKTSYQKAVRYDLDTETYKSIPLFEDINEVANLSVTNAGDVFGTVKYLTYTGGASYPTRSFYFREAEEKELMGDIITDQDRFMDFESFIRTIAPDLDLQGVSFRYEKKGNTYIQAVSADGSVIVGGTGSKTWVFDTEGEKVLAFNTPRNLNTKISDLKEVTINWQNAVSDSYYMEYEVDYYKVYRDGELISDGENIELYDLINYRYVDKDVTAGERSYSVSAMYKPRGMAIELGLISADAPSKESPRTESSVLMVANNFNIPFYDNFDTYSLTSNYWQTGKTSATWWGVIPDYGIDVTPTANCTGYGEPHSIFLTSKHLDARELESVFITYAKAFDISAYTDLTRDSLNVEVSIDGENWEVVKTHFPVIEASRGWEHVIIDISDKVAGELFQVRFHANGTGECVTTWFLEWFSVTNLLEQESPIEMKGYINDGAVKVSWTNSMNAHELTYLDTENYNFVSRKTYYIGNEQNDDLVVANAFDSYDLHIYNGMYLTAINAYLFGDESTELELVVYEDNTEIRRESIESFIPDADNTFVLKEPVLINKEKTLKYGIHVVKNTTESMFRYQSNSNAVTGKSDLYSVDNGTTWSTIYKAFEGSEDEEQKICSWYMSANITAAPLSLTELSRNEDVIAYYLYRAGEIINDSFYSYHKTFFVDTDNITDACYKVLAYHSDGTLSEFSAELCVEDLEDITGMYIINSIAQEKTGNISFYPNPVKDIITIIPAIKKVSLLNMNGQLVKETNENMLSVSGLTEGVYLMKLETIEGEVIIEKVTIKK